MKAIGLTPRQPSPDRIRSLDFLRGVAILGILFINTENFAYPDSWSPWRYGFERTLDYDTRFWVYFLTQGKFYTLFAILFGVGLYLLYQKLTEKYPKRALRFITRRLILLLIMGVIHYYFIWTGDILYHYAFCGFILLAFCSMSNQVLIMIMFLLGGLILNQSYDNNERRLAWYQFYKDASVISPMERTPEQQDQVRLWEDKTRLKQPDTASVMARKQTYWIGLIESYQMGSVHKGLFYHQNLVFSTLMTMILGVLLARSGIFVDYRKWSRYWLISSGIFFIGIGLNYWRYFHWTYEYFDPVIDLWKAWSFTFHKEILGLGYLLVLNGIYQQFLTTWKYDFISIIGKMTLSNYLFQNLLLGFIFYGYGLSKFNSFNRFELLAIVGIIWIIQILLSLLWMQKHVQGPIEWVWKKWTYASLDLRLDNDTLNFDSKKYSKMG